jgi:cyclic-di-GMP phosphodiesterase TipF (flagellum assembly factor)
VQRLIYVLIALTGLGLGVATYGGLAFSAVESATVALAFSAMGMTLAERTERRRSEARLDQGFQALARLLATNAKAGQMLSERLTTLTEADYSGRMEAIEADLSVLGAVVRQVAEALADLEEARDDAQGTPAPRAPAPPLAVEPDAFPHPLISPLELRAALDADRLVMHAAPVQLVAGRRAFGFDLVPQLLRGEDLFADAVEFMPRQGGEDLIRRIDALGWAEAIAVARKARSNRQNTRLFVPISRASLADATVMEELTEKLGDVEIASALVLSVTEAEWQRVGPREKKRLYALRKAGAAMALLDCATLRLDFADLKSMGFTSVRIDATRFLRNPDAYSDFHISDVAAFLKRYDVELCLTGIVDEQQLLAAAENGIGLASGPHIGRPEPIAKEAGLRAAPAERLKARA